MDETDGGNGPAEPAIGTLPFGGGGGLTDRSNVSNATVIAEELRGVVRNELRKLMEVGIVTYKHKYNISDNNI